jgi:hypothetical protein
MKQALMAGLCATAIFSSSGTLWSQQKPADEINPYDERAVSADMTTKRPVVIYTPENAPATPRLEELPLKESVSRYGITWIFEKPARVGQFINGDWYVVGAVTIKAIDPKPLYGGEIPERELDHMDKERPEDRRVRNGFMLDPPARMKVAYDSGIRAIKDTIGKDFNRHWSRQRQSWDPFVNEMWAKHRPALAAPTDGWKRQRNDSYYRTGHREVATAGERKAQE